MQKTIAILFLSLACGLFWHGAALATGSPEWKRFHEHVKAFGHRMHGHRD